MSDNIVEGLGIFLTSHPRQQMFWETAFLSLRGYKGFVLLAYDDVDADPILNFVNEKKNYLDLSVICSGKPQLRQDRWEKKPDGLPHQAARLRHLHGELNLIKLSGIELANRGYTYFLKGAADHTLYRYYNLPFVIRQLEERNLDFLMCGTTMFVGKVDKLNQVMEGYHRHMMIGAAEYYFYKTCRILNLKFEVEKRPWWEKWLCMLHVQGEYAIANNMDVSSTWLIGELWPRKIV